MINWIENSNLKAGQEGFEADIPVTDRERFAYGVYASLDDAVSGELGRLGREEGTVASCKRGCYHCCRYHILTSIVEAHALAQYIKRELSVEQIDGLRRRTQQWHEWDNSRPGRSPAANVDEPMDLSNYVPSCPMLVDGVCLAYPVRPVVCRTHLVCSHPFSCWAANDPDSTEDAPVVLASVVMAARPFAKMIRDYIENAGLDFCRSRMLLPHWLAIEMDWEFALSL